MADPTELTRGQIVFDHESEETPLIVDNPNPGTVGEQDDDTRDAIKGAADNDAYDTSDEAECISAFYLTGSGPSYRVYTFPAERLKEPERVEQFSHFPPTVYYQAKIVAKLFMEYDEIDEITAMDADLPGKVILAAEKLVEYHEPTEAFPDEVEA